MNEIREYIFRPNVCFLHKINLFGSFLQKALSKLKVALGVSQRKNQLC